MSIEKTILVERAREIPASKVAAREFALVERPLTGAPLISDAEGRGRWLVPVLLSVTADYTITETDFVVADSDLIVLVSCGASDLDLTLPTPTSGRTVVVKKMDTAAGKVRILGDIDGEGNYELTIPFNFVRVVGNGIQWYVIGNN